MNRGSQGVRAWLLQRISALYMLIYFIAAAAWLAVASPRGYEEWRAFIARPLIASATFGFVAALLLHAWVGVRDVVMDYIKPWTLRFWLLTTWALVLLFMAFWAAWVLTIGARG